MSFCAVRLGRDCEQSAVVEEDEMIVLAVTNGALWMKLIPVLQC